MSLSGTSQLRIPSSSQSHITHHFPKLLPLESPSFHLPIANLNFHVLLHRASVKLPRSSGSINSRRRQVSVYSSDGFVYGENRDNVGDFNFRLDSILSIVETACLVSSAIVSIVFAVKSSVFGVLGDRVLVWVVLVLVCGVAVGALIRRRHWSRIFSQSVKTGGRDLNLVERVEKLEEDLRSSATIIRVLSRQLEKLGIRFRVTRKALKEPIAETAALAQKNSEATRALAVQEDILEKELGEIQKVLLAMQEQQQKQLELILAISKTGRLWENRRAPILEKDTKEMYDLTEDGKPIEIHEAQSSSNERV